MDLNMIRNKIDSIDSKILKLLDDRMKLAIMSSKFKEEIEDVGREKELINRIQKNSGAFISADFCSNLFEEIIKESKRIQEIDRKTNCKTT